MVIFAVLLSGYYLFVLKPKLELPKARSEAQRVLRLHSSNLTSNRLSYVQLTRLDPDSSDFLTAKSNLVGSLQSTQKAGTELVEKESKIPDIDAKLTKDFPTLLTDTKQFFKDQEILLKEVYQTSSYQGGVKILKSDKALELLTRQTNLLLQFQFWQDKLVPS